MIKFSEFVEKTLGIEFLEYQRIYIDALYLRWKELGEPKVTIIPPRRCTGLKYDFQMMCACMMPFYEKEFRKNEK